VLVRGLHQLFQWTRQTICFEMCASPISLRHVLTATSNRSHHRVVIFSREQERARSSRPLLGPGWPSNSLTASGNRRSERSRARAQDVPCCRWPPCCRLPT
jgi:hypothetical protein